MIRFAVIGRNFVTERMLEAAKYVPELKLSGICSRSAEGAREFAQRYGIDAAHRYVGISELCKAEDIDAVYIATPNSLHEEQAMRLIGSGKHVFVEKPAATSAESFGRMMRAAKNSGVILMEGMMPVHMPGYAVVRRLIKYITPVRRADLSYLQYSSRYDKYKSGVIENAFRPELGGGSLMDIGVYCAAFAEGIFGTPRSLSAEALFLENGIDGEGSAILMYNGMMVGLGYSKITDSAISSQICGEGGCISVDSVSRPRYVTLTLRDGTVRRFDAGHLDLEKYSMIKLDDEALASIEIDESGKTPSDDVEVLPDMTHELRRFVHLIERGSLQLAEREQYHTEATLSILDGIRSCCDIKFESAKRETRLS